MEGFRILKRLKIPLAKQKRLLRWRIKKLIQLKLVNGKDGHSKKRYLTKMVVDLRTRKASLLSVGYP